jgi:hypothetical protein
MVLARPRCEDRKGEHKLDALNFRGHRLCALPSHGRRKRRQMYIFGYPETGEVTKSDKFRGITTTGCEI